MKYYCEQCHGTFDKPCVTLEKHGLDTPPYEISLGCPWCGSNEYKVNAKCEACDKQLDEEGITTASGLHYCSACFEYFNPYKETYD